MSGGRRANVPHSVNRTDTDEATFSCSRRRVHESRRNAGSMTVTTDEQKARRASSNVKSSRHIIVPFRSFAVLDPRVGHTMGRIFSIYPCPLSL